MRKQSSPSGNESATVGAFAFPPASKKERGYDKQEVEELFQRAQRTYENNLREGEKAVSVSEIRTRAFHLRKRHGLQTRFVDAVLDRLESELYKRERKEFLQKSGGDAWRANYHELEREITMRAVRRAKKKFRSAGLFACGYKRKEVDEFVEKMVHVVQSHQVVDLAVLREHKFHSQWNGYEETQVDAYIETLVDLMLSRQ